MPIWNKNENSSFSQWRCVERLLGWKSHQNMYEKYEKKNVHGNKNNKIENIFRAGLEKDLNKLKRVVHVFYWESDKQQTRA